MKSGWDLVHFPSLKREALFFSKIAIQDQVQIYQDAAYGPVGFVDPGRLMEELNWLTENGIVFEPDHIMADTPSHDRLQANEDYKAAEKLEDYWTESFESLTSKPFDREKQRDLLREIAYAHNQIEQSRLLKLSAQLRALNDCDAYPVFFEVAAPIEASHAKKHDVVQVVLKQFPILDYSISWEQILDYRDDPETAGKVLGLRRWMSKIARSQISHQEIEEELEWLIFEYQSHLKFHRLKTNMGTLESLITIAGEVLENLLTIQWGKATRALFSLKRRQLASAEIKLTAPGKEIAYVIDTRDQFKK